MNNDWQQFLVSQGATIADNGEVNFDGGLLPDCSLSALGQLGLIRVSGEEAQSFLQGQFTNDVSKVDAGHSQLSSFCSPKGRMLALFRIFQRGDDLYLMMPRERLPAIHKRLQMFVLRAKVTLTDASDELAIAGLAGTCLEGLLPAAPAEVDGCCESDGLSVIRVAGDRPRCLVIGEPAAMQAWWQGLDGEARPASAHGWPLLDIRAGIPTVVDATAEAFVPQMANMQLVNGVSFTKGCYTGQEVVARMQYLGTLKRRMYRVRFDGDACPAPGSELFSHSSASGQGAGKVVDARPSPDGGCEALVITQISSMEADDLQLGDADGARLQPLPLPYSFTAESQ